MAAIRFVKNINLEVEFDGETNLISFKFGDIFKVVKIEIDNQGYNNIFLPDSSILRGVASTIFEKMGKVPVKILPKEVVVPEVKEEKEEPKKSKPKSKEDESSTAKTE